MVTFLFWNLNQKSLEARVASLAEKYEVDIVILAECSISSQSMIDALHQRTGRRFNLPFSACEKIVIYTRFPKSFLKTKREGERFTIRRLALPGVDDVLVVATHFPSKLFWSKESQAQECFELSGEIRLAEQKAGHSRTVLVGDLNMNPFEDGVVSASGLHGVMTRQIAAKQKRVVQGREYSFFYNPMWGRLGDETEGPAGTHYYQKAEHINFFWNTFDQVLLRPSLLPFFRNEEMKVLTDDGETRLISGSGLPNKSLGSDHLPILFRLHLQRKETHMAANQRDLWPAISTPTNAGFPVAILREQAALLQDKTRGLVTAEVLSGTGVPLTAGELGEQYIFHHFYLVAPLLENYRYRLFTVEHPKLEQMYPLLIKDSPVGEVKVDTEEDFVEALRKIFTHDKTQKIIEALIAQSPLD